VASRLLAYSALAAVDPLEGRFKGSDMYFGCLFMFCGNHKDKIVMVGALAHLSGLQF